jgi:hypothetical protein
MQIEMTVLSAQAERNEKGETESELVAFGLPNGDANFRIRLKDPALFGTIHPKQKFTLTIEPAPPIEELAATEAAA